MGTLFDDIAFNALEGHSSLGSRPFSASPARDFVSA
jgi:hypothetical protein